MGLFLRLELFGGRPVDSTVLSECERYMSRTRLAALLTATFLAVVAVLILRDWVHLEPPAQRQFTMARLYHELNSERPVLVTFYARWDTDTFDQLQRMSDRVPQLLEERNVAVLRADWTEKSADIDHLMRRLGLRAVPAIAIFIPDDRANPIVLPDLTSEDTLVARIERLNYHEHDRPVR